MCFSPWKYRSYINLCKCGLLARMGQHNLKHLPNALLKTSCSLNLFFCYFETSGLWSPRFYGILMFKIQNFIHLSLLIVALDMYKASQENPCPSSVQKFWTDLYCLPSMQLPLVLKLKYVFTSTGNCLILLGLFIVLNSRTLIHN